MYTASYVQNQVEAMKAYCRGGYHPPAPVRR